MVLIFLLKAPQSRTHDMAKPKDKIIAAAFVHEPFVVFNVQHNVFNGLDIKILRSFGEKVNMSVEFIKAERYFRFGKLFKKFLKKVNVS